MHDNQPTARARHIGMELRRALVKAGLDGNQMAERFGCSPSKISRMLSGKRLPERAHVAAFLALCGVKSPRWDAILDLADDPYNPLWWRDYGVPVPTRVPERDEIEADASAIVCYGDTLVPDLVRTTEYTRALLGAIPGVPDGEIEDRVAETVRRQAILERPAPPELRGQVEPPARPELVIYLAEYVLTRTGAGDDVMSDQAHHLLRMALRPDVDVRVIPDGRHTAGTKPFTLFRFPDFAPVVYIEHPTSVAYLEKPETVAAYQQAVRTLNQAALDTASTRHRLAEIGRRGTRTAEER